MGIRRKGREVALQTLYALSYEITRQEDQLSYYLESYSERIISCSESERSQLAYVTFKDSQGADTAALLSVSLFSI